VEPRVSYALVGLFVVVLGGAFLALSLWLISVGPGGQFRTYVVYMHESVAGLTTQSLVKYEGVDVGQVTSIRLDEKDPSRVRLLLRVRVDAPVNRDTVATIAAQGLTGLIYFVELHGGGPESPPLKVKPGAEYPEIAWEPSFMSRLRADGTALLSQLRSTSVDVRSTLALVRQALGPSNQQAIASALDNAKALTARLATTAGTLEQQMGRLGPLLDGAMRFEKRLPGLADRADQALQSTKAGATAIRGAADALAKVVKASGPGLIQLAREGLPQISPLLNELRGLVERLRHLAGELENQPGVLLYGRPRRPGPGE
jgi:phospholipid/cholesterol/gamma-HCH transport system substrate-binding protein